MAAAGQASLFCGGPAHGLLPKGLNPLGVLALSGPRLVDDEVNLGWHQPALDGERLVDDGRLVIEMQGEAAAQIVQV